MKKQRCLYCYQPLDATAKGLLHAKCSTKMFGTPQPPRISLNPEKLKELAAQNVLHSTALTGVQPKLSLQLAKDKHHLTIVGLWGRYILKPQAEQYANMPENEDLTMHLAAIAGIKTAEHTLLQTDEGQLVYVVKRFDRDAKNNKIACEDLCQLSGFVTENKYLGSMEKAGKKLKEYVHYPIPTALAFFELAVFCFVTGNADMHLKNFSVLQDAKGRYGLSPAYDLLCTKLLLPADTEEMALTLNARKRKLTLNDFYVFGTNIGLSEKQMQYVLKKLHNAMPAMLQFINISFLPDETKTAYAQLLTQRMKRLETRD